LAAFIKPLMKMWKNPSWKALIRKIHWNWN